MEAAKGPEAFSFGMKSDSVTPMINGIAPMINENSLESHVIISEHEHLQDLCHLDSPGTARTKRADFNAGAMTRDEIEYAQEEAQGIISLNSEEGF